MKKLLFTQRNDALHWVGDGFPVRTIFSYNDIAKEISPFLLMDYAGPTEFSPSEHIRGVGSHPHRGFETVTIVYEGEVAHRDSAGGGGLIRAGDVQWMTAASGLVHEEMHGENFAKTGGPFEMIQLWVNLPRKYKTHAPRYQAIKKDQIPVVQLPEQAGVVRVIAGQFMAGIAQTKTFTPINLWDIRLIAGRSAQFTVPDGHTASLFVLSGKVSLGSGEELKEASLHVLSRQGDSFKIIANRDAKILFLGGEPIEEPIVGYGPFVMNSYGEIKQAVIDFEEGRMGYLEAIEGSEE